MKLFDGFACPVVFFGQEKLFGKKKIMNKNSAGKQIFDQNFFGQEKNFWLKGNYGKKNC